MRTLHFNFNNEVDTFEIREEDDGRIVIPGEDGEAMAEYQSLQQFAEIYAQARDVRPDNLKNWTLVEHGDVVSFVLRAGTAGVSAEEIRPAVEDALAAVAAMDGFHPLDVERVRQDLQDADDVMRALALSSAADVARAVYDRLAEANAFVVAAPVEEEAPEVDERSALERYLDDVKENDGSLAFFANMMGLDADAGKEEILVAFEASPVPYTAEMVANLYEDAVGNAMGGIHVENRFDALLVIMQSVPADPDEAAKNRLKVATGLAGRAVLNIGSYTVGRHHVKKSAALIPLAELDNMDLYMVDNKPMTVTFDPDVDAELEAEREEKEARAAEEGGSLTGAMAITGAMVREMIAEADDEYDDYDDYDEEERYEGDGDEE